mgnify:CR=1 FL=1
MTGHAAPVGEVAPAQHADHRAEPRQVLPDPVHGDLVLTKFMNYVMYEGKKSAAEQIVYGALDTVEQKVKRPSIEAFHDALANVAPSIEVRSRRVGGATYQVPVEVRSVRRTTLAGLPGVSEARSAPPSAFTRFMPA